MIAFTTFLFLRAVGHIRTARARRRKLREDSGVDAVIRAQYVREPGTLHYKLDQTTF